MAKKQRERDPLPPIVPQRFLTFPTRKEINDGAEGFIQVPKSYVSFPANALKVWLWLHERYGARERHSWESYPNMAAELDISSKTVQRMVQWLVQERAVICVEQKKRGAGHTNCLIALTEQPSVDEFNDLTQRLQDAWLKKQDKKSPLSRTIIPEKQDFLSAEAGHIVRRLTSKRKPSINQQPAPTREAVEAAVDSNESSDQRRAATKELSNPLSLATNLSAPQSSAAGEGSSLVDPKASPGATGRGIPMPTESHEVLARLKGGQA